MAIKGSLQEAGLPDVIQMLYLGRRTGCLSVSERGSLASLYFEDGWVTDAAMVNRPDRLGDILVRSGRLTPAQLEEAIAMQARQQGRRLGAVLVELGHLQPDDIRRAVRRQVEEAVYAMFGWRRGSFSFEPGVRTPNPDSVRLAPEALLLEGARRVDEWALIQSKIPSFDLVFAVDRSRAATADPELSDLQRRLLDLLDGVRDVRTLVDEAGSTEFDTCRALYGLVTAGLAQRVGTSPPAAGRPREAQIEEHRNLGVAFYRTGMLEESLREFRRVMELRPAEGAAPFHLGLIAARQGRWADASYFFRRAADRAGPRAAILHNLGVALALAGEPDQAETTLREATSRAPDGPRTLIAWAILALDRGDVHPALVRLERARGLLDPEIPALWYWAAVRALAGVGDLDRALEVATEGVDRWPGVPALLNNQAVLLEAAGELPGAEAALQQALERDPGLPEVSKNLGDVLYRLGRYDEAWTAFQRALRLQPEGGDDLHFKLGNLALRRGDAEDARSHWRRAVELNPRHQLARANLQSAVGSDAALR